MAFDSRLAKAKAFEDDVERFCIACGYQVAKNGTEHTHPIFVELLRQNNSEASKFVRFAPDGVALMAACGVVHWEAKSGNNIERDAYETYLKYHDMDCRVLVFVRSNRGNVYCQWIERIGFVPSIDVVSRFKRRHPIDEDDWITPRADPNRIKSGRASGTPYKEIDFESLKLLPDFYQRLAA